MVESNSHTTKDGREFIQIGEEAYTRVNGTDMVLWVWKGACAKCSAPFEVKTPADRYSLTAFQRKHCDEHKLTWPEAMAAGRAARKVKIKEKGRELSARQEAVMSYLRKVTGQYGSFLDFERVVRAVKVHVGGHRDPKVVFTSSAIAKGKHGYMVRHEILPALERQGLLRIVGGRVCLTEEVSDLL